MAGFDSSHGVLGVAAVVTLLGIKHGFDADHLAAIDGMTRFNAPVRPRVARLAGVLFSLGHGAVVMAVAVAASLAARAWQPPVWLDRFGAWTSIAVLVLLAFGNVRAAFAAHPGQLVRPVGWRTGLFERWLAARSPGAVMGVGALFAVSFDTLSQAALFAVTSTQFGGWLAAALLAGLFVVGMLVTDGINGVWISRLIRRSDRTARLASRLMTLAVAGVGLLTAGVGIAAQTSGTAGAWLEGKAPWLSAAIVAVVLASFLIGLRLASTSRANRRVAANGS